MVGKIPPDLKPGDLLLITFGQPRVGNIAYAHDQLVPNSFRLVHRYGSGKYI
jgi:hypothetical protein